MSAEIIIIAIWNKTYTSICSATNWRECARHSISKFWKYLNAKITPQPFTTGESFTIAVLVLAIFDSAIALALQSNNNRNYLSVPAQDARNASWNSLWVFLAKVSL